MTSRFISAIAILLVLCSGLVFCQSENEENVEVKNITVDEAHKIISERPDVTVIDVRTHAEYVGKLGRIEGAELRPVQQIQSWVTEMDSLRSEEILVVCKSGGRSFKAAYYLTSLGFENVSNVDGGMLAWNRNGFPVEHEQAQKSEEQ